MDKIINEISNIKVLNLKEYNNIDQIALGSKIIIPYIVNEAI